MDTSQGQAKKVLLLYFSFSSQTKNLIQALSDGLEDHNVLIVRERLRPVTKLRFPIGTIPRTIWLMLLTFFRKRVPIHPLSEQAFADYDLIILAGPTWSYNPSGPVLALFDRDGKKLFSSKKVLPLISCRGYWRMHWWGLKALLKKCHANVVNLIVFTHPNPEPWRTLGVFLKLAGRTPERNSWMSKYYRKYGHTRDQLAQAHSYGDRLGAALVNNEDLSALHFEVD
ncbi:flavodoxin family protein [Desulfolithobacter sp.]